MKEKPERNDERKREFTETSDRHISISISLTASLIDAINRKVGNGIGVRSQYFERLAREDLGL